jgi:adenylate kinase
MRLVFLGPPGSGKGTQARLLSDRLGLAAIGTGDILRDAVKRGTPLGKKVEEYLVSGRLAPDELVNDVVAERFHRPDRPSRFVLDGYPRTMQQAAAIDKTLTELGLPLQRAILFTVPVEELVRRIGGRRLAEGRRDDTEETARKRLVEYETNTAPLIDYYRRDGRLYEVDATADVESVYKSVANLSGG